MMLAAIWIAISCVVPAVQATRSLGHAARRSPPTKVFLQQNATRKSFLHQPQGLASDFFTHDPEKMDELPQYTGPPTSCHPKCLWKCGGGCDQVCTPECAPPKCETSCGALEISMCHQKCEPPKCAVVCPAQCETVECPKCKTVCAPPVCHTNCADNCESRCADPQCSWKCKPSPECPKPACKLDCNNPKVCGLGIHNIRPNPPIAPDTRVMSSSLANLDPKSLPLGAAPPLGAHPPVGAGPMDGAKPMAPSPAPGVGADEPGVSNSVP